MLPYLGGAWPAGNESARVHRCCCFPAAPNMSTIWPTPLADRDGAALTLTSDWARGQGGCPVACWWNGREVGHVGRFTDYQKRLACDDTSADHGAEACATFPIVVPFRWEDASPARVMEDGARSGCAITGPMWHRRYAAGHAPCGWALSWGQRAPWAGHHPAPGTEAETLICEMAELSTTTA